MREYFLWIFLALTVLLAPGTITTEASAEKDDFKVNVTRIESSDFDGGVTRRLITINHSSKTHVFLESSMGASAGRAVALIRVE